MTKKIVFAMALLFSTTIFAQEQKEKKSFFLDEVKMRYYPISNNFFIDKITEDAEIDKVTSGLALDLTVLKKITKKIALETGVEYFSYDTKYNDFLNMGMQVLGVPFYANIDFFKIFYFRAGVNFMYLRERGEILGVPTYLPWHFTIGGGLGLGVKYQIKKFVLSAEFGGLYGGEKGKDINSQRGFKYGVGYRF